VFLTSKTFEIFSCSTKMFVFFRIFYALNLGANKENSLHVTYRIISLLLLLLFYIKVISRCYINDI